MIIVLLRLLAAWLYVPRHRRGILKIADLPGIRDHIFYRAGAHHAGVYTFGGLT